MMLLTSLIDSVVISANHTYRMNTSEDPDTSVPAGAILEVVE